jgi:transcriptional regulator with XRE-family HTH domain
MSRIPLNPLGSNSLGDYLREQRQAARLSLRQLSELAGVSNPYLSQIERGLKRPSAEILQQLAKGLEVSAESLYVHAGILDARHQDAPDQPDTRAAISADPLLNQRQKAALLDIYDSFVGGSAPDAHAHAAPPKAARTPKAARRPKTAKSPQAPTSPGPLAPKTAQPSTPKK